MSETLTMMVVGYVALVALVLTFVMGARRLNHNPNDLLEEDARQIRHWQRWRQAIERDPSAHSGPYATVWADTRTAG